MDGWLPALIAGIVALLSGGGIASWYLLSSQKRKESASTADILTGTALELVENMRKTVEEVREELAEAKTELAAVRVENGKLATRLAKAEAELETVKVVMGQWHVGIELLTQQIEGAGMKPTWKPPKAKGGVKELAPPVAAKE